MTFQLLLLLLGQSAPSERLHVEWVAPTGCPDESQLASTLASEVPKNRTFSASVRIDEPRESGRPWRAVVTTRLADGQERTRVVDGPDCVRVTEAAVLVLTLAATNVAEDEKGTSTPAVLPPAEPPLPPLEKAEPKGPPSQFTLGLRVQPVVSANVGVLPLPGIAAGIGLTALRGPVRLELTVNDWLENQTTESRRGARFNLVSAKVAGCWTFLPRPTLRVGPCLAVEAGALRGVATGVTEPSPTSTFWLATFAGAAIGFEPSPYLHPWLSLELGLNVVRPTFVIHTPTDDVVAHRMGLPVGRFSAGLEILIP